ncbi:MAG: type II toxin-antitoxin system VapC family toxin [Vicinamibacterales bacterium]|jgi:predicted nucleic acid-binding protein
MTLVVDASAVGAVLFNEADGATVSAHTEGETLIAPHLIDFELANICWKRIRREPKDGAALLTMLTGLVHVNINRVAVPATEVAALAVRTGLTAYDASYLWLALSRDLELVTLDNQLARVNQAMRERFV